MRQWQRKSNDGFNTLLNRMTTSVEWNVQGWEVSLHGHRNANSENRLTSSFFAFVSSPFVTKTVPGRNVRNFSTALRHDMSVAARSQLTAFSKTTVKPLNPLFTCLRSVYTPHFLHCPAVAQLRTRHVPTSQRAAYDRRRGLLRRR